jgi:hypothetical protein
MSEQTSYFHMLTQYLVLNTTANLHHRTLLPTTATKEKAISIFRNHDILIRLDPDLQHYEPAPAEPNDSTKTKRYNITDVMHTLPRGLWDTSVSFSAEITDIDDGVEWIVRAPLGLVQKSLWTVEVAGEKDRGEEDEAVEGRLVLVEDVEIRCSRLLVGTVKGKCEENWRGVHERWVQKLNEIQD